MLLCYKYPSLHSQILDPVTNILGISSNHSACRTLAARFAMLDYHIELLHYENCHYGRITSATDTVPTLTIPKLKGIVESKDLAIVVIYNIMYNL